MVNMGWGESCVFKYSPRYEWNGKVDIPDIVPHVLICFSEIESELGR